MRHRLVTIGLCATLTGCTSFVSPVTTDIVGACRTYSSVAAVIKLAAFIHPGIAAAVNAITRVVDPICDNVLTGQPAPPGVDGRWIAQRTNDLEAIEK